MQLQASDSFSLHFLSASVWPKIETLVIAKKSFYLNMGEKAKGKRLEYNDTIKGMPMQHNTFFLCVEIYKLS